MGLIVREIFAAPEISLILLVKSFLQRPPMLLKPNWFQKSYLTISIENGALIESNKVNDSKYNY